ncbi:hypothetical protein NMG60_11020599 [Bertholletia excelsa]
MRILCVAQLSFFIIFVISTSQTSTLAVPEQGTTLPPGLTLGEVSSGSWESGILIGDAQAQGPANEQQLVLAASRTNRPDILRGFKRYRGGWDIDNKHYWASVGSTGAFAFIIALLWFVSFGLALVVHHCCGRKIKVEDKGSHLWQRICLILLLIVFACTAVIGCILLLVGQGKLKDEVSDTLEYVVNQSDYTVQTLRNVTEYLSIAKTLKVAQILLPPNVNDEIDKVDAELGGAADTLSSKTSESSVQLWRVLHPVQSSLIAIAVVVLLLSLGGLCMYYWKISLALSCIDFSFPVNTFYLFHTYPHCLQHRIAGLSIFGHEIAIQVFISSGWLLVALTFILCGLFLIVNNAISDTCVAMEEWEDNAQAESALSSILPCVDPITANHSFVQSKEVINNIVNMVNVYIYSFANIDPGPGSFNYYNQSGPLMPPLCSPYDNQLQDRQCSFPYEVTMGNASQVWQNFTCVVSPFGLCTSVGRMTPDMYGQLVAAVNLTSGLQHYAPLLLNFRNCNFARETFQEITSAHCPRLENHLRTVNAGLGLMSVGVMLSIALWFFYTDFLRKSILASKTGS